MYHDMTFTNLFVAKYIGWKIDPQNEMTFINLFVAKYVGWKIDPKNERQFWINQKWQRLFFYNAFKIETDNHKRPITQYFE